MYAKPGAWTDTAAEESSPPGSFWHRVIPPGPGPLRRPSFGQAATPERSGPTPGYARSMCWHKARPRACHPGAGYGLRRRIRSALAWATRSLSAGASGAVRMNSAAFPVGSNG